jgi:capsular exopolysaccharide synthesis family protein
VASSVALLLRETQARVLLIDGDLRRPTLHTIFAIDPVPGLSELLAGPEDADPPIATALDVEVLPAGTPQIASAAQLGSKRMRRVVEAARDRYDFVIIDSPPSLGLPDSSVLSTMVDGVVVVCAGDRTPREALQSVTDQLRSVGASVLGVVLNRVDMNRHSYYYGRHHSAYYGTPDKKVATLPSETPQPAEGFGRGET